MYMNEEKLPFKDLPREVQHEYLDLALDGKLDAIIFGTWIKKLDSNICHDSIYRPAIEKPSLDWSPIDEKWKYCARDEDGKVFLYEFKPAKTCLYYYDVTKGGFVQINDIFKSYKPGTVDWKDSLIERP